AEMAWCGQSGGQDRLGMDRPREMDWRGQDGREGAGGNEGPRQVWIQRRTQPGRSCQHACKEYLFFSCATQRAHGSNPTREMDGRGQSCGEERIGLDCPSEPDWTGQIPTEPTEA